MRSISIDKFNLLEVFMQKLNSLLLAIFVLAGCASMHYEPYAREVKKKPREGGVIALKTEHRPEDRARADFLMSANCGQESIVRVAEEGEVVVGEKTNSTTNKAQENQSESVFRLGGIAFASPGRPGENTNTQSQTIHLKEWHISYQCTATAPPKQLPLARKKAAN